MLSLSKLRNASPTARAACPVSLSGLLILAMACFVHRVDAAGEDMYEMLLGQRPVSGMALAWTKDRVLLLRRDGQILDFPPAQVTQVRKADHVFRAMTGPELRGELLREFGPAFDVQTAGRYVVVHPKSRPEPWARHFDTLHRSFLHYFRARGVATAKPRFPLVAVVLPDRLSFLKYASRDGATLPPNCAGYYSNFTNRVVQYDHGEGNNSALIIHEASHQIAFNTGIHHRGSPPPRWLSEGLGTMFEAPGVWNSSANPNREARINPGQLAAFRKFLPERPAGSLPSFISNDWLFRNDVQSAYAQAWALSFYLSETKPRSWANYLRITSQPQRQGSSDSATRLREFVTAFGADLKTLEAHFLQYMSEL